MLKTYVHCYYSMIRNYVYNLQLFLLLSRMTEFSNSRIALLYSVVTACFAALEVDLQRHMQCPLHLKCFAFVVHCVCVSCFPAQPVLKF